MLYTYYVDTDESVACQKCYANDPCPATKTTGTETVQCARCDEDVKPDGYDTQDYPVSLQEDIEQEHEEFLIKRFL